MRAKRFIRIAVVVAAAVAGAALLFIYSGVYNVSAARQHTPPVYWGLFTAGRRSIRVHAREVPRPPDLRDPQLVKRGLILYERNCLVCHGAPGVAPGPFAMGMNPPPPNLLPWARELSARQIYWIVTNGIKMTGMPAFQYRMNRQERWAIVAFVKTMPAWSPAEYRTQRLQSLRGTHEGRR